MMQDAESHAAEDKRRKEEIETRNQADQAVYGTEKMRQGMGEKVGRRRPAGDRIGHQRRQEGARSKNDPAAIKSALDALTAAQHKAAEALYKRQAGSARRGGRAGRGPRRWGRRGSGARRRRAQDDVIDAEVVEDGKK